MKKVKSKINQETILFPVLKETSKANLPKLTAFPIDHLCGCPPPKG